MGQTFLPSKRVTLMEGLRMIRFFVFELACANLVVVVVVVVGVAAWPRLTSRPSGGIVFHVCIKVTVPSASGRQPKVGETSSARQKRAGLSGEPARPSG